MPYYTKTARQVLQELGTSTNGLAISEAEERLRIHGYNAVKVAGEPLWRKLVEPFANVFMLVLFIAAGISFYHGELLDVIIIGVIIFVSVAIYYVQRFSTERILRTLQKKNAQIVEVFRDGRPTQLNAELLVPGDVILLIEGEKIPADARLLDTSSLRVDESQLTGESLPVSKQTDVISADKEVYEQANMVFQGSFVVGGEALAVVVSTGNNTQFGQLAVLSKDVATESPVQKKIDRLISQIIAVVAALALVAFGLSLLRGMDFTESLRFVLALSVSAVPESLPVAITVVLVLGMRRMAAKNALVRTMRAIETIGVITTIATDKTGTLTKNKLTVQEVWRPSESRTNIAQLLAKATNHNPHHIHDPLDTALDDFSKLHHAKMSSQPALVSFPFHQSTAMSGNLWHKGSVYELVVKGAPEHMLVRSDLTEREREEAEIELHKLTANGYRVIAVAHSELHHPIATLDELKPSQKLHFEGFVAIADVLRPEAKKAIQAAIDSGVTVRMITGDHFETAYHIGRQLGMVNRRDQVFDSRRMSVMSDEELERVIDSVRVFSRVIPEHKYRILALLKKHNITAMTGDGVNDVPALTNAHVGVAMGSGASIAKDAGDIILIDDNFKSIVDAMREGRTIFANIRRMLYYLLSTNSGEVLATLGALVIGIPIPLVPVQILWVNLVTDTLMDIPLGLEPGENAHMIARPQTPNAPILNRIMITRMAIIAISMAILTLGMYILFSNQHGHNYGQTIAFNTLVVMQWASAMCARSDTESIFKRIRVFNGMFYTGLLIAITLQLLALFGPLSDLLHVTPVAVIDLGATTIIAFATPIILTEIHKYLDRHKVLT